MKDKETVSTDGRPVALLVEDETLVALIAEEALDELGFRTLLAADAASAMAALRAGPSPALALVDVGLPDLRGDQLAVQMRAFAPDMRIIIASGYDKTSLRVAFGEDAMIRFLSKPYTEADLALVIRGLGLAVPDRA